MLGRSLMLVTALSPTIGYDKASAIAHKVGSRTRRGRPSGRNTYTTAALKSGAIGIEPIIAFTWILTSRLRLRGLPPSLGLML